MNSNIPMSIETMQNCVITLQKQQRNFLLDRTDKFINIPDFPLTPEQKQEMLDYRQNLRNYFQQDDVKSWKFTFENQELPPLPTKPSFFLGF